MRARLAFAVVTVFLLQGAALGALQVAVEPERIPPVALGDSRVWSGYVTVTVTRDGGPGGGASVELRSPAATLASGRTDAAGRALLSLLSREPVSLQVWVDGADSGRRVELAAAGPGGSGVSSATAPSAGTPGPAGIPGWALGVAAVGIGVLFSVFAFKKRFKRRN